MSGHLLYYLIDLNNMYHIGETARLRWDSNPQSSNENTQLVSGLNEAQILYVSVQKEFRERQSDR